LIIFSLIRTRIVHNGFTWLSVMALLLTANAAAWAGGGDCDGDSEAQRLGKQVMAVAAVIRDPSAADAMATVTALGTDSRYYTMVRGWLMLALQGDQSILAASAPGERPDIEARIDFLRRAIRAIDLE
jgi:hypothetical protein